MSEQEQRNDFAAKQALAAKDKVIRELTLQVERHERANGSLVAELWKMRDERDAARRESDKMRAEVHEHEDKAALEADVDEPSVADAAYVVGADGKTLAAARAIEAPAVRGLATIDLYMDHMLKGGVVEHTGGCRGRQRRIRDGRDELRNGPHDDWLCSPLGHRFEMDADCYRLLPIEGGAQ